METDHKEVKNSTLITDEVAFGTTDLKLTMPQGKDTEQSTALIQTHTLKMKKQPLCDVAKRKAHHKASMGSASQIRSLMNDVLQELIDSGHVIVYINDVCIFNDTIEEHIEVLDKVLKALHDLGLRVVYSRLPYATRTNGLVERANGRILPHLRKNVNGDVDHWSEYLAKTTFEFNAQFHAGLKISPFELLFSYTPRGIIDNQLKADIHEPQQDIEMVRQEAFDNITAYLNSMKTKHDRKHPPAS
ncbi:hypothetical protein MRX96_017275 [Rhipicephalus microplus]